MQHRVKGVLKKYQGPGGWIFLAVPRTLTERIVKKGKTNFIGWGFVPIQATLNKVSWRTSLLPVGDGSFMIAVKKEIRRNAKVEEGDNVVVTFSI